MTELKRTLTVRDGVGLLVGITIGSGIYTTPYLVAGYYSSAAGIMVTWLAVGAFVLVGGLIYAELGTRLPETGGEYVYMQRCFGPTAGFLFGWAQLFIVRTSPAAGLALVAADYAGYFIPMNASGRLGTALFLLAALGVLNVVGLRWSASFQNVTTAVKVFGLVAFVTGALLLLGLVDNELAGVSAPTGQLGPLGNVVAALMLVIFTHTGWDRVGYVAGEMKNPRAVIPKSMLIGLSAILLIYWAANFIFLRVLGIEGLRATPTPAADVAVGMVGAAGGALIAALAIVSALGSINGTMMSASRVYYRMARDGLFFRWLNFVHPTFRTPSRAIMAHVGWAAVILLVRGSFETIVAGMVFAVLIFYSMTTLALFRMRRASVGDAGAYRMPGYPLLPAIYLAGIVLLLSLRAWFEPAKSAVDLLFVFSGLPFAWYWTRRRKTSVASTGPSDPTE